MRIEGTNAVPLRSRAVASKNIYLCENGRVLLDNFSHCISMISPFDGKLRRHLHEYNDQLKDQILYLAPEVIFQVGWTFFRGSNWIIRSECQRIQFQKWCLQFGNSGLWISQWKPCLSEHALWESNCKMNWCFRENPLISRLVTVS